MSTATIKPAHQWQTHSAMAFRIAVRRNPAFAEDSRAESFELRFHDGRTGHATFGLRLQTADRVAASDQDLPYATKAWLAARGQRLLNLQVVDDSGEPLTLRREPFSLDDLSTFRAGETGAIAAARRLITLCPSNVELTHALGCFDRVVACETSSDFPEGVQALPRLGPDLAPDLDRIAQLAPDLVVSSLTVPGMERVVTGLYTRGIPQIVLAPRSLADVMQNAIQLGAALGVELRAAAVVSELEAQRSQLLAERRNPAARVYLEWWPRPMFTPGSDCYSNELIELAGGINVFKGRAGSSLEIEPHELVSAAPDICFVSWCGVRADKLDPENLRNREGLATLSAARNRHVYPLDEAFSGRPGPRMLEAARIMAQAIRSLG